MDYNKEIREFADSPDYGTYYGTFHGLAPNFCTFLGPMTGLGHNSIIFMIGGTLKILSQIYQNILECQLQLLINVLREMWSNKSQVATVKNDSLQKFTSEWRVRIDKSTWAPTNCKNYYQRGSPDGRPWGLWPGTTTEYWWRTKKLEPGQFNFQ